MGSINKLTSDEVREVVEEALTEAGCEGAANVSELLIEAEAEKVTAEIKDPKRRRGAELVIFRMILDKLEVAYAEELHVHEGGDEPTYYAG